MFRVSIDLKMYVRWKALFGWGIAFWLFLCLHDTFFVDPVTKGYDFDAHEEVWSAEPVDTTVQSKFEDSGLLGIETDEDNWNFLLTLMFWNALAFSTSLTLCTATRFAVSFGWKYKQHQKAEMVSSTKNLAKLIELTCYKNPLVAMFSLNRATQKSAEVEELELSPTKSDIKVAEAEIPPSTFAKQSISKIPILSSKSANSSRLLIFKDSHGGAPSGKEDEYSADGSQDPRTQQSAESSLSDYYIEKQRSRYNSQESSFSIPSSVLKEQARLSKKLDTLSREKIDIHAQLVAAQRECREAKNQLEDVMREKANLIEKLESATSQLKSNTRSKNLAIANLEQSEALVRDLKYQLERTVLEKESLKQRVSIIENTLANMCGNEDEVAIDSSSGQYFGKEQKTTDDSNERHQFQWKANDLSQSQKDVQKVQLRLMNLEKSIEKLKFTSWPSDESVSLCGRYTPDIDYKDLGVSDDMSPSQGLTMRTKSECPFEDEIVLNQQMYNSEDSTFSADILPTHRDYMRKYCGIGAGEEDRFYPASTEDESNDDCLRHREGLITTSPAFKQFLRNMPGDGRFTVAST